VLRPLLGGQEVEQVQLDVLIKRAKGALAAGMSKTEPSANTTPDTEVTKSSDVSEEIANKPVVAKVEAAAASEGTAAQVTLAVSLSEEFLAQVSPEDSVFLYAKAQVGPPMPLAAQRLQVKNLPITVVLNDSMAMMPQFKLSAFSSLIVGARVSKSGNAISQDGDLIVEAENISHGDNVTLVINRVLKK
jgi:cytochrome c-type biogenesis protein CcmH